MTENEPMLQSSHPPIPSKSRKLVSKHVEYVCASFKKTYAKFIRLIHAQQFLAEFLATFVLVVRYIILHYIPMYNYICM